MTLDESAPAEFLFGHLNIELGSETPEIGPKISPYLATFFYFIIATGYAGLVLVFQYYILHFQSGPSPVIGISASIIGLILIAGLKSQVTLKRYGPDLVERSKGVTKFILTQIILAYILSFAVLFGIVLVIWYNQAQNSPITLMLAALIALFIYTRGISDIGLITAGLGIGIFPSWGGVRNSVDNLYLISNVNGSKENHLAVLRLGLWIFTYSMLIVDHVFWLLALGDLLFIILFLRWERANGSSILMKIRGIIQELSPSDLPVQPVNFDFNDDPIILEEPKPEKHGIYDLIRHRKQPSTRSFLSNPTNDLVPVAKQSLNKIVDKIKNEHYQKTTKMYCKSCNKEMEADSRLCIHCSDPLEFVADSTG